MKEMTFNQQMILKYAQQYKKFYKEKYFEEPKSWWGFTVWLTNRRPDRNFTQDDIEFIIEVMKNELSVK